MTPDELAIAQRLYDDAGLTRPAASLAVSMVTREHSRPESELIDIVRQYQWLDSQEDARNAVRELKQKGWLVECKDYGVPLLRQHKYLRKKIADSLDDETVKEKLRAIRSAVDPFVTVVGSMNDDFAYTSYLRLLESAASEICLPMLATTSEIQSVPILKQRAKSGVKIRILLASPLVVATLRGNTMIQTAEEAIRGWVHHATGISNMEVRVVERVPDTYLATCMLIDQTLLRFDVYDPHRQRSLQGTLVEFSSPDGLDLNICRVFREQFDDIWNRSRPTALCRRFCWWAKKYWNIGVGILFWIVAALVPTGVLQGICGSLSAGFWMNAIVIFFGKRRNLRDGSNNG